MKSSGSRLTRSSRKRIACSLPSTLAALAALAGTGLAAGTVDGDEFDGADERLLPQPEFDRAAKAKAADRICLKVDLRTVIQQRRRSDWATRRLGEFESLSLSPLRPVSMGYGALQLRLRCGAIC